MIEIILLNIFRYIPLGKIETEMKTNHFVEQVCVCADSFQDYIVALVQVNEKNLKALACSVGVDPTKDNKELCKVNPYFVTYTNLRDNDKWENLQADINQKWASEYK